MKVKDIFVYSQGNSMELMNLETSASSKINFISRTAQNNGVVSQVDEVESVQPFASGLITVALSGNGVCSAYVQPKPFYTAFHIMILEPKTEMSLIEKLYYCMCIKCNAYKYSWGRQANKTLKEIELPDVIPDWVYNVPFDELNTNNSIQLPNLDVSSWKEFEYAEIFDIRKGFYNKKPECIINGTIPFLGATEKNNGVTEYYSLEDIENTSKTGDANNAPITEKIFPANSVCVTNNGSVGFAFFQDKPFTCSHDVNPLYLLEGEFNVYTGLFVATVIMRDRYRWDYGRKWRPVRMIKSVITLPQNSKGEPDWAFMENYIKSLPYGDKL